MLLPMTNDSEHHIVAVREALLAWFALNRRDLPWRMTRDPYRILVSEVMLQQTQVDRVIPYYERWLDAFPTIDDLAQAPTSTVIRLWSGLGYNRRAVNLQRTARAVIDQFGGVFPQEESDLRRLPGIGPYTAGAISAFAFEKDVAFLDTNMRRVIHRLFVGSDYSMEVASDSELLPIARALVGEGLGWLINQALIEFGALHCTQRRPLCVVCPLQTQCRAFPRIQSDITNLPPGKRLKNEGTFEGSNRQLRGRIVDRLRVDHRTTLEVLGSAVKDSFASSDLPWLYSVVCGLERDGLVQIEESGEEYDASSPDPNLVVSLPD